MSERENRKRKSKSWYRKQAFKQRKTDGKPGHRLTAGLKGFIVTCNDRERDAVKESYNILNEYADMLYGPERKEEAESDGESDDDIEAAIAKEVQSLKEAATTGERRFQNSQTGTKNCIFIKTTLDDPVGLAQAIFTDLRQNRVQKSKYALRLLPVVGTCRASVKDISELAKVVLQPFFTDTKFEVTFGINFKARNNNGMGREMTISTLRDTIMQTFPSVLLRFTHANPQITILVEVMCGVACIAVAKDFALFRKYNLLEVVHDRLATEDNSDVKSEDAPVKLLSSTENNSDVKSEDTPVKPLSSTKDNSDVHMEDTPVEQQVVDPLEGEQKEGSAMNSASRLSECVSGKDADRGSDISESVPADDTTQQSDSAVSVSVQLQQEGQCDESSASELQPQDSDKTEGGLEVSENAGDKPIDTDVACGEGTTACPVLTEQETEDTVSPSINVIPVVERAAEAESAQH